MTALPEILHQPIAALLEEGDKLFDKNKLEAALIKYQEAFALLPSDLERWEASTWVLTAIGDTQFLLGDCASAYTALAQAAQCPQGAENPFVQLRLGQCAFEIGELDTAYAALILARQLGGDEVFEDEDDKYLGLLSGR